ncbi:MAG: type II secretion system F family protein [Candidatus Omnitrophica bacterium]|nr:type II secretion system F family protein [Candidatus Omnitrophota bacterium]
MPRYTYTAKSQPKETIRGKIEAESEEEAINRLSAMGYFPISLQPEGILQDKRLVWRFGKKSKRDLTIITRQLSSLIESGVNILNSLNIILTQTSDKYLKSVLSDIIGKIKDGRSLSESLSSHPYLFSHLYASIIHSGEIGGNVDQALKRLADFLEKEEEFKNSLIAALTYPFFVLVVGALTVVVLLTFVIPRFVTMFTDMGQVLPLPTRVLINLSGFLRGYWWFILAIIFMVIFFCKRLYNKPAGKMQLDRIKLKAAILGNIILKTEVGRLMRTLSLLLSSGIPIVQSLELSSMAIENQVLKLEVQKFKEQINAGASFSDCLKNSKLFPAFLTNIINVGEETGRLEAALLRIADTYERDTDRALKGFSRLLEPLIILVVGLIVGFIVLSMLLPIFQINLIVR